jgi:hypothetical protein
VTDDARERGGGLRPLRTALDAWKPARGRNIDPVDAIASAWPGIVGRDVAANSTPLELIGTNLVVGTRSSAWSQQLHFLSLHVLAAIRALPSGGTVERLTFRTGLASRGKRRAAAPAVARRSKDVALRPAASDLPAPDLATAFERLRARMTAASRVSGARCAGCGVVIESEPTPTGSAVARCAPCAGEAERERRTLVERIVYMAPWLAIEEMREEIPDLRNAEFERVRKRLLSRWWLILERTKRAGAVSSSGVERHVASSYVLLHTRLPPDRITPAVVRNLLGTDLEKILWPHTAP